MIAERPATLETGDGLHLEARLTLPASSRGGIVICHPHPLYGGDMDNPVVVRVQEVCVGLGFAALRFNFRGVGASTGTHDGGGGEECDVEAALIHLRREVSDGPVALAGYSFGAVVSARVAARQTVLGGLALLAPPVALSGPEGFGVLEEFEPPLLIVAGSADEYCPREALADLARRLPRAEVTVLDGANHFFLGKLFPLGEAVAGWARGLVAGHAGRRGRAG